MKQISLSPLAILLLTACQVVQDDANANYHTYKVLTQKGDTITTFLPDTCKKGDVRILESARGNEKVMVIEKIK